MAYGEICQNVSLSHEGLAEELAGRDGVLRIACPSDLWSVAKEVHETFGETTRDDLVA